MLVSSVTFLVVFRANNGYQRYWEAVVSPRRGEGGGGIFDIFFSIFGGGGVGTRGGGGARVAGVGRGPWRSGGAARLFLFDEGPHPEGGGAFGIVPLGGGRGGPTTDGGAPPPLSRASKIAVGRQREWGPLNPLEIFELETLDFGRVECFFNGGAGTRLYGAGGRSPSLEDN